MSGRGGSDAARLRKKKIVIAAMAALAAAIYVPRFLGGGGRELAIDEAEGAALAEIGLAEEGGPEAGPGAEGLGGAAPAEEPGQPSGRHGLASEGPALASEAPEAGPTPDRRAGAGGRRAVRPRGPIPDVDPATMTWGRDIFRPVLSTKAGGGRGVGELRLRTIFRMGDEALAILDGHIVRPGDAILDARVKEIRDRSVVLESGGAVTEIELQARRAEKKDEPEAIPGIGDADAELPGGEEDAVPPGAGASEEREVAERRS